MTKNEAIEMIINAIAPKGMDKEEKEWWIKFSISYNNKKNKEKQKNT